MAKVIHLSRNSVREVLERLTSIEGSIEEICAFYSVRVKNGARYYRIITGNLDDPFSWYGVIVGLAHDRFLHGTGIPLDELSDEDME